MIDLSKEPIRAYSKEYRLRNNRQKKTAKQRGAISAAVAAKVDERSGNRCEWCGWPLGAYDPTGRRMGLQRAHLTRRGKISERTTECDVAKLCGPSVNSGTCHWKVDFTQAGREWAREYSLKLYAARVDSVESKK